MALPENTAPGKVYVVVLNWNQWQLTADCVESLLRQTYPNYRVVIVDNGSQDGSAQLLAARFGAGVDILCNGANLGYTGGNNAGIRFALAQLGQEAGFVLLLNNDTLADDERLIEELVKPFCEDSGVGLVSPSIFYFDSPGKVWYAGAELDLWRGWRHCSELPATAAACETGYASGCCVLASSRMIRQIGELNEHYFLTMEDVEWSYRARRAGWRVIYAPAGRLLHKESMSSRGRGAGMFSPARVYYEHRNAIWFVREYATPVQKWGVWPLRLAAHYLYQASGYILLRRWSKLRALGRALRDGVLTPAARFCSRQGATLP